MNQDLNLNQLRAFHFVATFGSITRAAEHLFITQPAVSMQLKALESQYRTRLFERRKKKLFLTETGQRLFEVSKKIFGLIGEAEEVLGQCEDADTDVLKIGSTKTLVRYLLAACIADFRKKSPRILIHVSEGSSQGMVESVLAFKNDLAIVGRTNYCEKLKVIPFIRDELVLLAAPGHPLCSKRPLSLEDLRAEDLIVREKGSGTRRVIDRVLGERGVVIAPFIETENVDFIKELVRTGNGITL
ncbi:MAG: LysR substrate-binding domain-containing protein, partial [Pseudomonadota bacterium]